MKENTLEAWIGTAAALLLLASAMWEGFASLMLAMVIIIFFAAYKNANSNQKWQLKTVVYILLVVMMGLLDWIAVRSLALSKTPVYWSYITLGVTLAMVYLTVMWEQKRK